MAQRKDRVTDEADGSRKAASYLFRPVLFDGQRPIPHPNGGPARLIWAPNGIIRAPLKRIFGDDALGLDPARWILGKAGIA